MAITIFHQVINKVTIINRNPNKEEKPKEEKTNQRLNAKLTLNRHTRSEVKTYD